MPFSECLEDVLPKNLNIKAIALISVHKTCAVRSDNCLYDKTVPPAYLFQIVIESDGFLLLTTASRLS